MRPRALLVIASAVLVGTAALAQRPDAFVASRDDPAIAYSTGPVTDRVSKLNQQIQDGSVRLAFRPVSGYLHSVIDALNIPIESQLAVFSQTSFFLKQISPANPRAAYFNDDTAVTWVRGAEALEIATQDPRQGIIFYTLDQTAAERPQFKRDDQCLLCHLTWDTLGVPGMQVLSTFPMPEDKNAYANGFTSDHRHPFEQRWGGWYVTGVTRGFRHLGNRGAPISLASLDGQFDTSGFLAPFSDVVALMILEHQTYMMNLITRVGWEERVAGSVTDRVSDAVNDLVDYMLFVDEAPLPGPVLGSSGYADQFSGRGPRDSKGRSLRQLDLEHRLTRYPCSYMIYSDAFDALPRPVKDAIYARMWAVLSGRVAQDKYTRIQAEDRQAIVEILRETKKDLPAAFGEAERKP